jgi:hypothetical protein
VCFDWRWLLCQSRNAKDGKQHKACQNSCEHDWVLVFQERVDLAR